MNEVIRKDLTIQPPRGYFPSLSAALAVWGNDITEEDIELSKSHL